MTDKNEIKYIYSRLIIPLSFTLLFFLFILSNMSSQCARALARSIPAITVPTNNRWRDL